jgi:hypothetical protein
MAKLAFEKYKKIEPLWTGQSAARKVLKKKKSLNKNKLHTGILEQDKQGFFK